MTQPTDAELLKEAEKHLDAILGQVSPRMDDGSCYCCGRRAGKHDEDCPWTEAWNFLRRIQESADLRELHVGDRVRCVDDKNQEAEEISRDSVYTVRGFMENGWLLLSGCEFGYLPRRFKLEESHNAD